MPVFRYKAMDPQGNLARGKLDAINDVDLELRLRRMGLDLITFRELRSGDSARGGGVDRKELINFCFDMEHINRAGIPLLEGLRDLRDSIERSRFKQIISALMEDIQGEKMLSQAMAQFPKVFDPVFVSLVAAGEQTGRLPDVFENLSKSLRWQDELAAETKKLLIYPTMLLILTIGVSLFLLMYLVPQLVGVLRTMRIELPVQTRILIATSDFAMEYWWVIIGLPVIVVSTLAILVRTDPRARYLADLAKLRLPVIGPLLQKIILARFANFFGLMYQSGISILDALRTSEGIVGNAVIAEGLRSAWQQINSGEPMSDSFQRLGLFPPLVIRMLRVGESTGALDTALFNVNYFYGRDVREGVERALKVMGPALNLILGVLMALILFSILTPIYEMIGKLKF
ncbi:MAG: type II secretion system F family protein [Betaproteobacteria bacterium]|nr:type II secretion system F family protein [Betaproteobacteria bacterium]